MIRAVVGAGGKTSYIKKCAKACVKQGQKVFVTTSTHMFIEDDTLLTDDPEQILQELEKKGYVMAGIPQGEKIGPLSKKTYEKVCKHADMVLIEADGSKHMPIKFPNAQEPVIYENVDEIVIICGLQALHQPLVQSAHRLELVKQCLQMQDDQILYAEQIQQLVRKGYVEPMQEQYKGKKISIKPNHDHSLYQRAIAKLMEEDIDVSVLKEEWFAPQPKLIICGAGHVSCELVKIASRLDFYTKVIDDRKEFVSEERFPEASERICDGFEHLEAYMEPNAYYVVVTRGHQDDFTCVKTILTQPYQYLGMIGSKGKVKKTFEKLEEAGVEKEKIETIFAPIGLDIRAVTPAEIAVSILAQIILEKNKKHCASASKELLEVKETGVLCVIIEKKGSIPRGEGSMMFVTNEKVIDSIGGGAVEYAAIEDARNCSQVMIKEYELNREKSRELGMICGGSCKVLFLPIFE